MSRFASIHLLMSQNCSVPLPHHEGITREFPVVSVDASVASIAVHRDHLLLWQIATLK